MALKSKTITIEKGRDEGMTYLITEMPISKADNWAMRALFAIANGGVDLESVNPNMGMLGMANVAIKALAGIDPKVGIPLLDELLECVQVVPSGGNARALLLDSDVKDLTTMFTLRKEALAIHLDFLVQGGGLSSKS
ncbi:hypothetical protein AB7185_11130 [Providencia rettgeri]|uniref:hypothetical protein n=1 Tax=Providencia TaxID=586 RepID=UPI001B3693D3|nr:MULTISPECIES: hypothetical protein [Providencia]ELM3939557.1 hypothetical protein [Providencia rettgeri]EMA4647330.1 hypothetical protein [Providencia rettgeri]EMA4783451.1 hypothetical protein [Providencia rettgeri]MBQ0534021.1 hypothetical protein [Providencia huaxiensis]MBQ0588720.1 hypothetical protein [Providencia huaxiensis]